MLNGLSLFSGIGGLDVALSDWVRPVAYCEIDTYCQGVLLSRQADGSLHKAPIWDDIRSFNGIIFSGAVDIIYGGFPCQDISVAGLGKGLAGERSGLFFEIMRLAKEIKPQFIFLENVPAITARGGLTVVRTIAEMGYDCRWCVISAASVGAWHKRARWFLLAYSKGTRLESQRTGTSRTESGQPIASCNDSDVPHTRCEHERGEKKPEWTYDQPSGCCGFWEVEPNMGRVADGIPNRVDRIKALGNAVVPEQAKEAFKILMGLL